MNILDITPADIERLKENKIVFGLMDERDIKILREIDIHNTELYCASGFYRCRAGASFGGTLVYRICPNYTIPAPTEAEIIKYLQASEVPPAQWHPAAQEWARRHDGQVIWQFKTLFSGVWKSAMHVLDRDENFIETHIHRLRADYGQTERCKDVVVDHADLLDIVDKTRAKEPEVCVWVFNPCYASKCWIGPHNQIRHFADECYKFCPYCGKRIETKA